jgi:methylated-DNA-[protein]-cysteine S-methyltransferase
MSTIRERLERARRAEVGDAVERAAARFREQAAGAGLLDIAYGWIDTPVGRLLVAATEDGVVRVSFPHESIDLTLADLARKVSPRILEDGARLELTRRQLGEYFEGRRKSFDLRLDRRLIHGFHRQVLDVTERIPYGSVSTYKKVAEKAGSPRASRAAGNALGSNPIPIIIPCHRVVATGRGLGGYGGGLDKKQLLLDLEGANPW